MSSHEHRRSFWKLRLGIAVAALGAKAVGGAVGVGVRHRTRLAPCYAAAGLAAAGAFTAAISDGIRTAACFVLVGTVWLTWCTLGRQWWALRRSAPAASSLTLHQQAHVWATWAGAAVWLLLAARHGIGAPMPGLLGLWTLAAGVPWWWQYGRADRQKNAIDPRVTTWLNKVGKTGGALPASELTDVAILGKNDGWTAEVVLPAGDLTLDQVRAAWPRIASAYGTDRSNVVVDRADSFREDRARITVMRRSATSTELIYDETLQGVEEGCVLFGVYPDGSKGWLRIWQPGSGPVHDLFAGDSGSGKSRGMELAIVQSVATGYVVPIVGDPQGGQSLPAWAGVEGKAAWKATDMDGVAAQLAGIKEAMYERSRFMAKAAWKDEDGITRRGLMAFDPEYMLAEHGMPILEYTLDEAHIVMAEKDLADAVDEIAKMARKTGIKIRLGTQYPSMDQLGNRVTIRQQLVGGNVVSYKTSSAGSQSMVLPSWMPNPYDIPKTTPKGDHTKGTCVLDSSAPGSSRATYLRSAFISNGFKWADYVIGRMPALDPLTAYALGDVFNGRTPAAEPERETITVLPATGRTTKREAILEYLRDHRYATTGTVAAALDMPLGTVSTSCKRLAAEGLLADVRHGAWAYLDPNQQLPASA